MYLDWYKVLKEVRNSDKCCMNCLQKDFERENGSVSAEDFRKMLRGTLEVDPLVLGYIVNKTGCSLKDIMYTEDEDTAIPEELKKIAREYDIILSRDLKNGERNSAYSAGDGIFLNQFDNPDKERFAFFHELAHCIGRELLAKALDTDKMPTHSLSTISLEGFCWEVAQSIAEKYGYHYRWGCDERYYALNQYATYLTDEHIKEVRKGI